MDNELKQQQTKQTQLKIKYMYWLKFECSLNVLNEDFLIFNYFLDTFVLRFLFLKGEINNRNENVWKICYLTINHS